MNKDDVKLSHLGHVSPAVWSHIEDTIVKALGNRVILVAEKPNEPITWNLKNQPAKLPVSITLGLILHPVDAISLLTKVSFSLFFLFTI